MYQSPKQAQQISAVMLFCIFGLFACSSSKPEAAAVKTPPPKQTSKGANALEVASDDDFGGGSEAAEPGKKKLASAKVPKPVLHLSVEGKKTGKMLDAVVIEQQNEFLGRNIIKITKAGARLESSMLTIIINPAHPPQAYNVQNGSTMALSAKSAALMAGSAPQTANLVTEHSKGKPDKVADIPCTYYDVSKFEINQKTKAKEEVWHADIWATKNLGMNSDIQKACADMLQIPIELGFPLRITQFASNKEKALMKHSHSPRNLVKEVILTKSLKHEKVDAGQFGKFEGFKPVKNEMELMMSDDAETLGGDLDDMDTK